MSDPFASVNEALNRGEPIPPCDVHVFGTFFDAVQRLERERPDLFQPNVAVAGGLGSEFSSLDPEQQMSFGLRRRILASLISGGQLEGFIADNASRERVLRAAATMPCNLADLAFTFSSSAEVATFSERFLAWMRDNC